MNNCQLSFTTFSVDRSYWKMFSTANFSTITWKFYAITRNSCLRHRFYCDSIYTWKCIIRYLMPSVALSIIQPMFLWNVKKYDVNFYAIKVICTFQFYFTSFYFTQNNSLSSLILAPLYQIKLILGTSQKKRKRTCK